jgi:uncharacterized protein YciI
VAWLVVLRPVRAKMPFGPTEEEGVVLAEHAAFLVREHEAGRILLAGPSVVEGDTFGVTVVALDDEAEARELMTSDPAVEGGIMTAELRPLRLLVPTS